MYPALTEEEVMEKLNTIPVFGITDAKGNSVAVKTEEGDMVNWVFLNRDLASHLVGQFEAQVQAGGDTAAVGVSGSLQVSDVPLGMVWKALTMPGADKQGMPMSQAVDGSEMAVQLRLLADPTDLAIARNMSGTVESAEASPEFVEARAAKVARLEQPWGVVPVFTMAGMKIRVKNSTDAGAEPVELRPWFLSIASCVASYKKAMGLEGAEAEAALRSDEAALHMATLEELTEAMMKPSPIDFRQIVFMPSESSIEHMRSKMEKLLQEVQNQKAGGAPPAAAPSGGGLFDDDEDDTSGNVF